MLGADGTAQIHGHVMDDAVDLSHAGLACLLAPVARHHRVVVKIAIAHMAEGKGRMPGNRASSAASARATKAGMAETGTLMSCFTPFPACACASAWASRSAHSRRRCPVDAAKTASRTSRPPDRRRAVPPAPAQGPRRGSARSLPPEDTKDGPRRRARLGQAQRQPHA